jgi:XTP/dITP diphosphohydrolase
MPRTLVLGTRNRKKVEELRPLLADLPLTLTAVADFSGAPDVPEEGQTFEANARAKAAGYAVAVREWTLAEDSGLVVPALGGEPGVHSALYAGRHGDNEANNDKLLAKIAIVPENQRAAYYVCVAALADPQGNVVAVTEGRCGGRIVAERRGTAGFGYDPLFLIPEYHKTFGELSAVVKQALSHRARAMERMRAHLIRNLLGERGA